jgi:hypothetical protein
MLMPVEQQIPDDAPVMQAWIAHQATDEYANNLKWVAYPEHAVGSLWALFYAGYFACAVAAARDSMPPDPKHGNGVLVTVSGYTGSGKSAIAGEIEIALKAIGVTASWPDGASEKHMTHADWQSALETYNPTVVIRELNIPRPKDG